MPDFPDLAALNAWLEQRCMELWHEIPHGVLPGSVADVWAEEQAVLMQLPPAFDGFVEHSKRVSPTCLISFERNRYSVPASFANRPVSLRVYPDRLVVVLEARLWRDAAEGNILCEHVRVIQRSHKLPPQTIYDWRHYLAVIQRKPPLTVCKQTVAGQREHCAMAHHFSNYLSHSDSYRSRCCAAPVATERWSISWRSSCTMMSKLFWPQWKWL